MLALRCTFYRKLIVLLGGLAFATVLLYLWLSQVDSRRIGGCVRTTHQCLRRCERGLVTM